MGGITKSLAELIATATHNATPGNTDNILISPTPNTPFVTQCTRCTVTELAAAILPTIPANQIVYGGIGGMTSDARLTRLDNLGLTYSLQIGDGLTSYSNVNDSGIESRSDGTVNLWLISAQSQTPEGRFIAHAGTIAAPSPTANGASLGALYFDGLDTLGVRKDAVAIFGEVDGVVGAGSIPGFLSLATANAGGVLTNRLTINSAGLVNVVGDLKAGGYQASDGTAGETAVILAAGLVSITVKNGLVTAHA